MTALIPMSDRDLRLSAARAALRTADEQDEATLRVACRELLCHGGPVDASRAELMLRALDREAADRVFLLEQERLFEETVARARASGVWPAAWADPWEEDELAWADLFAAAVGLAALVVAVVGVLAIGVGLGVLR